MTPLYLRFADKDEAEGVLGALPTDPEAPQPVALIETQLARDDIGTLPSFDGTEPPPGYHVNLLLSGDPPEALQPYLVTPAHPRRRFAGF